MSEQYFVIRSSDGDVTVRVMTKQQLETDLNDEGFGHKDVLALKDLDRSFHDLTASGGTLIIKGELVVPKPVKVVERFKVD